MKTKGAHLGATGPRTQKGKARSSQNARKHGLTANKILPNEAELVFALFEEYRNEFQLEGAAEIGIGRKLAYNELRLRRITDYEMHRFEVADAYDALQSTDRRFRKHFDAIFLRRDGGKAPSHRLPASIAKQYLFNLKTRIESRGVQTEEDTQALAHIYGKEVDVLGATIIRKYCALERQQNNADPEAFRSLTTEIIRSIDAAIEVEQVRSQLQSAADSVEFASDVPVLAPDTELEQINRYRTQYERQRSRLFNELRIIRSLKGGS